MSELYSQRVEFDKVRKERQLSLEK